MSAMHAVHAGDIPDMWIRDSSVQLGVLLPRIKGNSYIQSIIEGAINMQAYYINNDPYANSYRCSSKACISRI